MFHAPLVPSYGLDTGRMMIAGYPIKWDNDPPRVENIWNFTHSLGIDVAFLGALDWQYDEMYDSPHRTENDRMVLLSSKNTKYMQSGLGREIEFFAFDTVPSPYYYCRFYDRSGGVFVRNPSTNDKYSNLAERLYTAANTTPGQMILGTPIYGYDSLKHVYRSPRYAWDSNAINMSAFLAHNNIHDDLKGFGRTFYFVTSARLDSLLGAPDSASVLRLEVWHQIPAGFRYLKDLAATDTATAAADTAILCDTFLIRRGELDAGYPGTPREFYRIISRPSDLRIRRVDGGIGPMHSRQLHESGHPKRLDIRVFWTGAENVAIRSIAIRDSIGELVMGTTDSSEYYRSLLFDFWKRMLYGPSEDPDSLRHAIIRIENGIESDFTPTEYASFERINQMLRDTFNLARYRQSLSQPMQPGDSLSAWQLNFAGRNFHQMTTPPEVTFEMGFNINYDTVAGFREYDDPRLEPRLNFEVPHNQIPSIKQHNGGRGYLPQLMDLDSLGITAHDNSLPDRIEAYTTTLQRMIVGFNQPNPGNDYQWPYHRLPASVDGYARAADIQRRTGRRFVSQIGTVNRFSLRAIPQGAGGILDTLIGHIPEPAELRLMTNLSLAYGARGILWWGLGTFNGVMQQKVVGTDTFWVNEFDDFTCCHGSNGLYHHDTINNVVDFELFHPADLTRPVAVIPNFYIGYGHRTGTVRDMNTRWLPRIGPELMKLRWRNGYSIHYATRWPGLVNDTLTRPIDTTEIFSSVTSRHPFASVPDSAHRTFVEIGLFDKKVGYDTLVSGGGDTTIQQNPIKDTSHVYIVNRRTFEPPADGILNLLDTLAETRTIAIQWRLQQHPDSTHYNFLRVQEIAGDTIPLPFTTQVRVPLDTVIRADSATLLTLGPGRAALLRITYCQPGDTLGPGDLRYSSQRKIVLGPDDRYHAVYWRRKREFVNEKDTVFYRRSVQMHRGSGGILWEPIEYAVSPDRIDTSLQANDCFPSVTCRHLGGDSTMVSVVWTNGNAVVVAPQRFVMLREILNVGNAPPQLRPIEQVDTLAGLDPEKWGLPAISSLHGGEMIAWSDSTVGIVARMRRLGGGYGDRDSVSLWAAIYYGLPAQATHPSMPSFAHQAGRDSSIGIVWQHTTPDGSMIFYARLIDSVAASGDTVIKKNVIPISQNDAEWHVHPSIDMTQNVWYGAQEGVTWESHKNIFPPFKDPSMITRLHFSSLFTETIRRWNPDWDNGAGGYWHPLWDSIENVQQWTYNTFLMSTDAPWTYRSFYPNTASINSRIDTNYALDPVTFSVATSASGSFAMQQSIVQYANNFIWPAPAAYAWGGAWPGGSASPGRQTNRHAALYQVDPDQSTLSTTRQYFAKERPRGYSATGRQVHFRIDERTRTAMGAMLHDVWVAGNAQTGPVRLAFRPDTLYRIDDSATALQLLVSEPFQAYDSTTVGLELGGQFLGDTALARGMRLECVAELIDSATGTVVQQLDSFIVAPGIPSYQDQLRHDLDLLSGSYRIRLRLRAHNLQVADILHGGRYPVEELTSFVAEETLGKLRRMEVATGHNSRVSAWPNPANTSTEIRFTLPSAGHASVILYDLNGRELLRPVERTMLEEGRYAVMTDLSGLPAGTYLLELSTGSKHMRQTTERLVIQR